MNEKVDLLCTEIWYGDIPKEINKQDLRNRVNNEKDEEKRILLIIDLLKLGDLSAKEMLIETMNISDNKKIINLCLRVFCAISQHQDFYENENLEVLSRCDEEEINTFVTYSKQTLSYEVIPYLLALLEEWEDTGIERIVRGALEDILSDERDLDNESIDNIGELYMVKYNIIDKDKYYYKGDLAFPGVLTKELIEACAISRMYNKELNEITIPTILSIWSGLKCPVSYYTIVDDIIMGKVLEYVKKLSEMKWEKGCKYFYGNKI